MDAHLILNWIQANWAQVVAALWAFEKLLEVVATLTPTKLDDNLGVILGKILAKIPGAKP